MGKASRRKRERHTDARAASLARGERLNKVGRRTPVTPEGLTNLAQRAGANGIARLLLARANERWDHAFAVAPALANVSLPFLAPLPALDVALRTHGAVYEAADINAPRSIEEQWPTYLLMTVDDVVDALRFLFVGQPIGAAAITRWLFERWTANLAYSTGLTPALNETPAEFSDRAWQRYPIAGPAPSQLLGELSEGLHGRGTLQRITEWEARQLLSGDQALEPMANVVLAALQRVLVQVRACVLDLLATAGDLSLARLIEPWPHASALSVEVLRLDPALWPITLDATQHPFTRVLSEASNQYWEALRQLPPARPLGELTVLAFLERRHRAYERARFAFMSEAEELGDGYNPQRLSQRVTHHVLVAEAAGVLALWEPNAEAAAGLAMAASATRSALWTWLEDHDYSLVMDRSILDGTAKARVWRLKPQRASRLAALGVRASAQRWADEAGWRRLSILIKALGEFAHFRPQAAQASARDLIADLHAPDTEDDPKKTARGNLLDRSVAILSAEVRERFSAISPALGDAFAELTTVDSTPDEVEHWLNRALKFRDTRLDRGEFFGPAIDNS